ncbi:MAG: hypothetical protein LBS85_02085, partial [Clostridiales Family XIII bacterium]|nr:hypothetical protein [Clostridiales Family XIII bacterium]
MDDNNNNNKTLIIITSWQEPETKTPIADSLSGVSGVSLGGTLEGCHIACADGGCAYAFAEGLVPDIVIGDFDSLAPEPIAEIERRHIAVRVHPKEK